MYIYLCYVGYPSSFADIWFNESISKEKAGVKSMGIMGYAACAVLLAAVTIVLANCGGQKIDASGKSLSDIGAEIAKEWEKKSL